MATRFFRPLKVSGLPKSGNRGNTWFSGPPSGHLTVILSGVSDKPESQMTPMDIHEIPRALSFTTLEVPDNAIGTVKEAQLPGDWKKIPSIVFPEE